MWDGVRGALWWIDIRQNRILLYSEAEGQIGQWWMPTQIYCLNITDKGRLIVALETGLYIFDPESGALERLGELMFGPETTRFNDGKVDPAGRLWVGTVDLENSTPSGILYVVQADGAYTAKVDGLKCSNGLGWTVDGRRMFYTDSRIKVIWSFDFEAETSTLSNKQVFKVIEEEGVGPDGLSVDVDGCVWTALFGGSAILRLDPVGREIERIPVAAKRPTSCAFGGANLKTLFVTTESFQLPIEDLRDTPHAGGLFAIGTDVAGVPINRFKESACA